MFMPMNLYTKDYRHRCLKIPLKLGCQSGKFIQKMGMSGLVYIIQIK